MTTTRAGHSCLAFTNSGEWLYPPHLQGVWEHRIGPICSACGWTENTHHDWKRDARPNGSLGLGWHCRRCGRTAYDLHGRCSPESPPIDYPPCSTWSSDS